MPKKIKDIPKEMKILLPTTKIKKSVKCENTKQAYEIFRKILDFDTSVHWKWQLNSETQNTSALRTESGIMGVDSAGYVSCIYVAAIGTKNWERLEPTDIFGTAIYYKSRKIYMAHNCPGRFDDINLCIKDFNLTLPVYRV